MLYSKSIDKTFLKMDKILLSYNKNKQKRQFSFIFLLIRLLIHLLHVWPNENKYLIENNTECVVNEMFVSRFDVLNSLKVKFEC